MYRCLLPNVCAGFGLYRAGRISLAGFLVTTYGRIGMIPEAWSIMHPVRILVAEVESIRPL